MSQEAPAPDLLSRIRTLPPENGGPRPDEGLLVALSGGADSVALLDLMVRLSQERPLKLAAAHLDHGLREDSAADSRFCRELCETLGVPLAMHRIDVGQLAQSTGEGLEAAGRRARYEWFGDVLAESGLDAVATAHHLDDHVETVLMWLLRGTGLTGLRGIAPRWGDRVRPLRHFTRDQIETYLGWRQLTWRRDPLNLDERFLRNRIRSELLPLMSELGGPGTATRVADFSRRARGDLELLGRLGRQLLDGMCVASDDSEVRLDRQRWIAQDRTAQLLVLRELALQHHSSTAHQLWTEATLNRMTDLVEGSTTGARTPLPGGGWLVLEHDVLSFRWNTGDATPPGKSSAGAAGPYRLVEELLPPSSDRVTLATSRTACFDAAAVHRPLLLRAPRPGDRIRPFGMQGHKKLTKLYQERGIPHDQRPAQLVLEDRRAILWAVGITTAEETRVRPETEQVLKVTLAPAGKDSLLP